MDLPTGLTPPAARLAMQTRVAVPADLPELRRVFRAAALSNAGDAPGLLARPELLAFAGDGIPSGRTRVAVVGTGSAARLVGFATVVDGPDGEPELEDLFTDPEWRRQGIARRLVGEIVEALRRAGRRRLAVTGNPHALDFYRAVGFVVVGEVSTELGPAPRLHLDLAHR
jgi:GNAT superfamily N-acetyltransferase